MTRNRFMTLKAMVHFCENDFWKVINLKEHTAIQESTESFKRIEIYEKDLSIDKMIVKHDGHNSLKQFIKRKPVRFRYKFWAMCGNSGYYYNFEKVWTVR